MKENWNLLSSRNDYSDRLLTIRHDRYHFVKNNNEKDYTVIDINNWVNIIPVTTDKKIILIKQYRHGIREIVTEIPGGVIEKEDASPEVAARRELLEETGYTSDRFINIGTVIPNPAIQSNKCYFYLAENSTKISSQNLDPQEDIEIFFVPEEEIYSMILNGEIKHSLVIDAFCLLMLYRKQSNYE